MSDSNKPPADQPVIQNPRTITKPRHTIAAALLAIYMDAANSRCLQRDLSQLSECFPINEGNPS